MSSSRPNRIQKTTLANEQMRQFEALYVVFEKEKSGKTWAEWLEDYVARIQRANPDEKFKHELFNQLFSLQLRLERIELTLMTVIDAVAPTITFNEVKAMLRTKEADAAIHEWLNGNQIPADANGLYRRSDVIKAFGNPPIG